MLPAVALVHAPSSPGGVLPVLALDVAHVVASVVGTPADLQLPGVGMVIDVVVAVRMELDAIAHALVHAQLHP